MPEKTIVVNRRARHEFSIEDTFEAGIVLTGTEIKSIRANKVNLAEAFARIDRGEAWLVGAHIAPWESGNRYNHEPRRNRKLLLHKSEIDELLGKTKSKGLTLVALRLYIDNRGKAKLELGLGKGKQLHDRRRDIADRDAKRQLERDLADATRR
jgi:SsrA-binding protein